MPEGRAVAGRADGAASPPLDVLRTEALRFALSDGPGPGRAETPRCRREDVTAWWQVAAGVRGWPGRGSTPQGGHIIDCSCGLLFYPSLARSGGRFGRTDGLTVLSGESLFIRGRDRWVGSSGFTDQRPHGPARGRPLRSGGMPAFWTRCIIVGPAAPVTGREDRVLGAVRKRQAVRSRKPRSVTRASGITESARNASCPNGLRSVDPRLRAAASTVA